MAKCFICVGDCILGCLEKICDYINNAAFAYCAVTGEAFCSAAYNGFLLNVKWAAAFGASKFLASSLIFLGKFAVTCANCLTLIGIMKAMTPEISNFVAPCVMTAILTWITCEIWLSLFD